MERYLIYKEIDGNWIATDLTANKLAYTGDFNGLVETIFNNGNITAVIQALILQR